MSENLRKLYNTMATIGTSGADTIKMADCLRFLHDLIEAEMKKEKDAMTETIPSESVQAEVVEE